MIFPKKNIQSLCVENDPALLEDQEKGCKNQLFPLRKKENVVPYE